MDVEEKIKNLEMRIAELEARIDLCEYKKAILALHEGDPGPLESYLLRGGRTRWLLGE